MIPKINRGQSFKGLAAYLIHDKREDLTAGPTAERVGMVQLLNFVGDEARTPEEAARVMAMTVRDADQLKAAAGVKNTGRKADGPPVWHCSLSWHPTEKPTEAEMLQAVEGALTAQGLGPEKGFQTFIVQHTDEEHAHVHIVVNLVHPVTGKQANPYREQQKAQRWAANYERERGAVFCTDRDAKYSAIEQGKTPDRKPKKAAQSREEWSQRRGANNDNGNAKEEAATIRAAYAAKVAELSDRNKAAALAEKNQQIDLWTAYQQERAAIRARYGDQIKAIYKHKRNRNALPLSRQGFRDWKESREWKALSNRQYQERKAFKRRERSMAGRMSNAAGLALHAPRGKGRGAWSVFFGVSTDQNSRLRLFELQQAEARKALADKHFQQRKNRTEPLRAQMDAELADLSRRFKEQQQENRIVQAAVRSMRQSEWRQLKTERGAVWSAYREKYGLKDKRPDREAAQAERRADFAGNAFDVTAPARVQKQQAARDNFRQNGADVTQGPAAGAKQTGTAGAFNPASSGEAAAKIEADKQRREAARSGEGWKARSKDRQPRNRQGGGRERDR